MSVTVTKTKIGSGVEGFDSLLGGGFPKGRSYLISGEPGTGKTIFTLQFLLEGLKNNEKCLYISIDEPPDHVIEDAMSLGWDLSEYLKSNQLQFLDISDFFSGNKEADVSVENVVKTILDFVKDHSITRLAIDPIAPLIFTHHIKSEIIHYVRQLIFELEQLRTCTTLMTSYIPVGSDQLSQLGIEEFAASGIILLKLKKHNNHYIRTVRLRKMRCTSIDLAEYSYTITPQRGLVLRQSI